MTSPLLNDKARMDELTNRAHSRIEEFQAFDEAVLKLQRQRIRKRACEYLDRLRSRILKESKAGAWAEVGNELGADGVKVISSLVQTDLTPQTTRHDSGRMIAISSNGDVFVPRNTFLKAGSILITLEEFRKCVEDIKRCLNEDPVDPKNAADVIVKGYFASFCKNHKTRT